MSVIYKNTGKWVLGALTLIGAMVVGGALAVTGNLTVSGTGTFTGLVTANGGAVVASSGVTPTANLLQAQNSIDSVRYFSVSSTATLVTAGSASAPSLGFLTDPDTGLFSAAANSLGFAVGGAEGLRVTSDGTLVVKATGASPPNLFQVQDVIDSVRYLTVSSTTTNINTGLDLESGVAAVSGDGVTINAASGKFSDTTAVNAGDDRTAITLTNSRISATSNVFVSMCSTPDSGATLIASATATSGAATVQVSNEGAGNQTSPWSVCFFVTD